MKLGVCGGGGGTWWRQKNLGVGLLGDLWMLCICVGGEEGIVRVDCLGEGGGGEGEGGPFSGEGLAPARYCVCLSARLKVGRGLTYLVAGGKFFGADVKLEIYPRGVMWGSCSDMSHSWIEKVRHRHLHLDILLNFVHHS